MQLLDLVFDDTGVEEGFVVFAVKHGRTVTRHFEPLKAPEAAPEDIFFGPAVRKSKGAQKEHCLGTTVLWADIDIDTPKPPVSILPPSAVVHSGHGWHLYWRLHEFATDHRLIEAANESVATDVQGDAVKDIGRLMRLPNTWNRKKEPAILCTLRELWPDHRYSLQDFGILPKLTDKIRTKIRTGSKRGYTSRSERDWAIVVALVSAGASDGLIVQLFEHHKCGDKYSEANGRNYLERTTASARKRFGARGQAGTFGILKTPEGFATTLKSGEVKLLSTFLYEPELLLEGEDEDALLGTIHARGHSWPEILLSRSAFNSAKGLTSQLPLAAWQWLGQDADARRLLPHLLDELEAKGMPRVRATKILGRHEVGGQAYFVTTSGTLSSSALLSPREAPIAFFPTGRMTTEVNIQLGEDPPEDILQAVQGLNEPEVVWPIFGWWAAASFKPALEDMGVRFPILNVVGTRGSGKTTTIQQVVMPMFGVTEPRAYNAQSTRFVILSLLGSTNAIPVALTEYRLATGEDILLRYILLLYDTGYDARGRPDQTTVEYPLLSPLVLDGEDVISDPAARERTIVVTMHPRSIAEGSDCWLAFQDFGDLDLSAFAGQYLQYTLQADVGRLWSEATESIYEAFPMKLPDRIRRNLSVTYLGILALFDFMDQEVLDTAGPKVLATSLESIFAPERGRAPTAADDFAEDIVAAVGNASSRPPEFFWVFDEEDSIMWFQLTPAHHWWTRQRRSRGSASLGRDAIRTQLRELETEYTIAPKRVEGHWCYGVNLTKASKLGLDVPETLAVTTLKIHI